MVFHDPIHSLVSLKNPAVTIFCSDGVLCQELDSDVGWLKGVETVGKIFEYFVVFGVGGIFHENYLYFHF